MRQEELRRLPANAVAPNSSAELLAKAVAELKRRPWRRPTLKGDPAGEGKLHGRPIGFTYVQLPKDRAPGELWPSMTWTDISSEYEGVFFRVVGGGAGGFGVVQLENAPRLEMVHTGNEKHKIQKIHHDLTNNVSIPVTGWSDGVRTGDLSSIENAFYINFKHTDTAEVRPKNMAVKVYKRTA